MSQTDQGKLVFEIKEEQYQQYLEWRRKIEERVAREQLQTGEGFGGKKLRDLVLKVIEKSLERGEPTPYYGSITEVYVFSFSPTTLGIDITVKNIVTGDEIVLKDEPIENSLPEKRQLHLNSNAERAILTTH